MICHYFFIYSFMYFSGYRHMKLECRQSKQHILYDQSHINAANMLGGYQSSGPLLQTHPYFTECRQERFKSGTCICKYPMHRDDAYKSLHLQLNIRDRARTVSKNDCIIFTSDLYLHRDKAGVKRLWSRMCSLPVFPSQSQPIPVV